MSALRDNGGILANNKSAEEHRTFSGVPLQRLVRRNEHFLLDYASGSVVCSAKAKAISLEESMSLPSR